MRREVFEKRMPMDSETRRAREENMAQLVNKVTLLVREERSLDELTPEEKNMLVEALEDYVELNKPANFSLTKILKGVYPENWNTMKDDTTEEKV